MGRVGPGGKAHRERHRSLIPEAAVVQAELLERTVRGEEQGSRRQ